MIVADVNVLVYAFRIDTPQHKVCKKWLLTIIDERDTFGVCELALSGFIRICTHPRIFKTPSTLEEVLKFAKFLLDQPNVIRVRPGERHWEIFNKLCMNSKAKGNLVPDAYFAALAIENDCEWITMDRDYSRFKGLKWSHPE